MIFKDKKFLAKIILFTIGISFYLFLLVFKFAALWYSKFTVDILIYSLISLGSFLGLTFLSGDKSKGFIIFSIYSALAISICGYYSFFDGKSFIIRIILILLFTMILLIQILPIIEITNLQDILDLNAGGTFAIALIITYIIYLAVWLAGRYYYKKRREKNNVKI